MTKQASSTPGGQRSDRSCRGEAHKSCSHERKTSSLKHLWSFEDGHRDGQDFQTFMTNCAGRHTLRPACTSDPSLPPSMDRDSHTEDTLSTMVLENIKNKLIHAFRATGESREDPQHSGSTVRPLSIGRSYQANEELRRAQIDGAITWLRSELLEMRSQDLQLAQTLLGLNSEIQRLRRESFGAVEVEGDDQH